YGRAGQSVSRINPMFRAEIQWLASGPTLKLEGRLVADWAEQARCLVTKDVLPKGLIVDLTEVSYVDSVGEQLLKWLASVGAVFVAGSVYAFAVCDRLRLSPMQRIAERRKRQHGSSGKRSSIKHTHPVEGVTKWRIMSWFHSSTSAVDARKHGHRSKVDDHSLVLLGLEARLHWPS